MHHKTEICLATRNKGKLKEISEMLAADLRTQGITLRLVSDYSTDEPVEDGGTYIANANIKAKAAALASHLPSLADDAGIEIDAMPEKFGVETAPDTAAMGGFEEVFKLVAARIAAGAPDTARHVVTFVLCTPDGETEVTQAIVPGTIVYPGRGGDWGFNPYFIPDGQEIEQPLTYAEIIEQQGMAAKNAVSARGKALNAMAQILSNMPAN